MSFEVEEEGEPGPGKEKDREKKRKKRRKDGVDDEEDSMWVEKAPPAVVTDFTTTVPVAVADAPMDSTNGQSSHDIAGPPRGRKRAIDFM